MPGASGLAAAAALYSAVQATVAENKPTEDTEDDEEGKASKEGIKTGKEVRRLARSCPRLSRCLALLAS